MAAIKVYLDEDVHHLIAQALNLRGWQASTTIDAGRQGTTDEEQLEYAIEQEFALLTYNVADFPRHHHQWMAAGKHHFGVIVATQENPSLNARTMLDLVSKFEAEDLQDQLLYLSSWM